MPQQDATTAALAARDTSKHEILQQLEELFEGLGIDALASEWMARGIIIAGVILLSIGAHFVARRVLLKGVTALISKSKTKWDDMFLEANVFERLAQIAPALVIYSCADWMFRDLEDLWDFTVRFSLSYMVLIGGRVVAALLDGLVKVYRGFDVAKNRPMKSFAQVGKIFTYAFCAIVILGTLMNKSPWALVTGVGAMMAIILLVFKDSILGLVAGIQLSANNMVRVGDWIEMPKYGADGDVIDISLTTIKVQNWDKTISTIPTYAFISDSFKNWRGMSESGGRRIKRSIHIDMNSAKFCDEPMLERFKKFSVIRDYIDEKLQDVKKFNDEQSVDGSVSVNGRRLTNLGTFRKYVQAYLSNHPKINDGMTLLVRHRQPTATGLPIEIYAFSNDKVWANYEDIQADIFDHLLAALPEFDLRVFQNPSGLDFRRVLSSAPSAASG